MGMGIAAAEPARAQQADLPGDPAIGSALRQLLDATPAPALDDQPLDLASLRSFYSRRDDRPAWLGSEAADARAKVVLAALETADRDGLEPADYHAAALAKRAAPAGAAAAAERELLITDAFLHYARDLRLGRLPPAKADVDVALPEQRFDARAALEAALAEGSLAALLADLAPPYPGYARLKAALPRYRGFLAAGGWPAVPSGPELALAGDDPRLAILRARLAVEDEGLAAGSEGAPKGALEAAVRRFQARNGLEVDGRIGAQTLAMLNVSAAERVSQIAANMERWRWLPRELEERRVAVNTADGALEAIDRGMPILVSKVVVGDEKHQSPILRARIVSVTVNPPWNVPYSIARKEILPKLKKDASYLFDENIVILNGAEDDPFGQKVNWRAISAQRFPYRLQQLPGPENSLGGIKLEMPNPFDVYLHDTPAKRLFARARRNYSHGCIRVEQALALASLALTGDPERAVADLEEKIAAGETRHLAVRKPLPVYLLYWTALADADGTVAFRADVYGRDRRLAAALAAHGRPVSQVKVPAPAPTRKESG